MAQPFDIAALQRIAWSAPQHADVPVEESECVPAPVRIGVAQDRAFGFYYQDTIDILRECGAEIVLFSPLDDDSLAHNIDGLYFGGGFLELYAADLARNQTMRAAMQEHARGGRPIYPECGGLMAWGRSLTTFEGFPGVADSIEPEQGPADVRSTIGDHGALARTRLELGQTVCPCTGKSRGWFRRVSLSNC